MRVTKDLYRGSAPSPADVVSLKNNFGINKIVSLDRRSGQRISNVTKKLGIEHIIIPIEATRSSLINLFQYDFKQLFLEDGPTFVHCYYGKDRTGLVIAIIKCKYFNESPDEAIAEAKLLGFGIGVPPKVTRLYEKIIRSCKPEKSFNKDDIVSQEREYIDDNKGSVLEGGSQGSFAPYLDQTKSLPNDFLYPSDLDQSPTRQNYNSIKERGKERNVVPLVGLFNNNSGGKGMGFVETTDGFVYD